MTISIKSKKLKSLFLNLANVSPLITAIVWPMSKESLEGTIAAAREKIIDPILIGEESRIKKIANNNNFDITKFEIIDVPLTNAVEIAIQLTRANKISAIMKGSLSSDELMAKIVHHESGLGTENRMSICVVTDIPSYKKLIIITDPGLNIAPNLLEKKSILQNAIGLARALHIKSPKVALLSATEKVTAKIPSTIASAELCKMAKLGQFKDAIVDGPMAIDVAFSAASAKCKNISSPVAGEADILLVPNLEAGNILYKSLEYMAGAINYSLVLGAKIPIILTSRSASLDERIGSCLLAKLCQIHETYSFKL